MAAGETLVFFASGLNRTTPPYATNFLLPCGSTAYLYNPQSSLVSQKGVFGSACPCLVERLGVLDFDRTVRFVMGGLSFRGHGSRALQRRGVHFFLAALGRFTPSFVA